MEAGVLDGDQVGVTAWARGLAVLEEAGVARPFLDGFADAEDALDRRALITRASTMLPAWSAVTRLWP